MRLFLFIVLLFLFWLWFLLLSLVLLLVELFLTFSFGGIQFFIYGSDLLPVLGLTSLRLPQMLSEACWVLFLVFGAIICPCLLLLVSNLKSL